MPLSPFVMLIQRYATPQTIWPIARVIITKPMPLPLPRSARVAKRAAAARVRASAAVTAAGWPCPPFRRRAAV
jgi:hypothetical protein